MEGSLFWISVSIFGFALILESWFSWRFLRRLKHGHQDMWHTMGCRTIWTDGDLFSAWPTIKFLLDRKYLETGSDADIAFCENYRSSLVGSYFFAGISVAFFLAVIAYNNFA